MRKGADFPCDEKKENSRSHDGMLKFGANPGGAGWHK